MSLNHRWRWRNDESQRCSRCHVVKTFGEGPQGGRVARFSWTTAPGSPRASDVRPSCWDVATQTGRYRHAWEVLEDEGVASGDVLKCGATWFCAPGEREFWVALRRPWGRRRKGGAVEAVARDVLIEQGVAAGLAFLGVEGDK